MNRSIELSNGDTLRIKPEGFTLERQQKPNVQTPVSKDEAWRLFLEGDFPEQFADKVSR